MTIKKWLIKDIEKKLDKTLKLSMFSLGIDVAHIQTGWALLKADKKYLYFIDKGIINTKKEKWITAKLDVLEEELKKIKITDKGKKVCVLERPYVKFKGVAITLGLSAGVAYSTIKKTFPYTFMLTASQARKRIGIFPANCKKVIAQKFIKDNFNINEKEDIIDGFVLALAGIIILKN